MKVEDIPDHTNKPRPRSRDMFEPPPQEIGDVVSGDSTLRTGDKGYPLWVLVAVSVGFFAFAGWVAHEFPKPQNIALAMMVAAGLSAGLFYVTRFKHVVTYVGRDGLARITVTGSRSGARRIEILRFASADCLRIGHLDIQVGIAHRHNSYEYRWYDRRDRHLFVIEGDHRSKVLAHDLENFATAAEVAWSVHRLARYREELAQDGVTLFALEGGKTVRLGDGFLELRGFERDPVRLTRDEVESVTLLDGKFRVNHVDATWYGKGKFAFSYARLGNAQVFVQMLKQLMSKRPAA